MAAGGWDRPKELRLTNGSELGIVGLGRMGANIARRLMRDGHRCVVYDVDPEPIETLAGEGADGAASLAELAGKLAAPRAVWVMVPAGEITEKTVEAVAAELQAGDAIIDGGNSYYRDDIRRAGEVASREIDYIDCGTSGGVFGLGRGYCLMIGGPDDAVRRLDPIFATLAPGVDSAARTPGRSGDPTPAEHGYLHCGPTGAGHFVKMVHNGIEYGVMAAYAEGLNVLRNANAGKVEREGDAETAPLEHPEYYRYDLDIPEVAEVWRRGSVIGSWLLDLTAAALRESPDLGDYAGRVSDSGEGRWTSIAAIEEGVPTPVLSTALYERFSSRDLDDYADKVLSAMRMQFGGHVEKKA
jgi:6-phosphogluconate dehydrogenase